MYKNFYIRAQPLRLDCGRPPACPLAPLGLPARARPPAPPARAAHRLATPPTLLSLHEPSAEGVLDGTAACCLPVYERPPLAASGWL